jgi:hypothetical protein
MLNSAEWLIITLLEGPGLLRAPRRPSMSAFPTKESRCALVVLTGCLTDRSDVTSAYQSLETH